MPVELINAERSHCQSEGLEEPWQLANGTGKPLANPIGARC